MTTLSTKNNKIGVHKKNNTNKKQNQIKIERVIDCQATNANYLSKNGRM
jgi:hypothetical protein